MADPDFTVHAAGEPVDWIQSCTRCGAVILDQTAWRDGRVAIPVGQEDDGPRWWPVGAQVADGGTFPRITYPINGRDLDADEKLCKLAVTVDGREIAAAVQGGERRG